MSSEHQPANTNPNTPADVDQLIAERIRSEAEDPVHAATRALLARVALEGPPVIKPDDYRQLRDTAREAVR